MEHPHGVQLPRPDPRPIDEIERNIAMWSTPKWRSTPHLSGPYCDGVVAMLRWGAGVDKVSPISRKSPRDGQRPGHLECLDEQYAAYEGMSTKRLGGHPLPDPEVMTGQWLQGAENAGGWLAGDNQSLWSASDEGWQERKSA